MHRSEIVNPEGLRFDGRRSKELRRIACKTSIFSQADGSSFLKQGNTQCIVTVYGPKEHGKRSVSLHDKATLNVNMQIAAFSSGIRKQQLRHDKKLLEAANSIKQVFQKVIHTSSFPRSEIEISIQLLQIDGGILHTAINATTLALIDAGIPMTDFVCSCSAGVFNDESILDLNHIEENAEVPTLTVALMPKTNKVVLVGLESRIHMEHLDNVLEVCSSV